MGNTNDGERDPNEKSGRFMCTSNRQDRKFNKTKTSKSKSAPSPVSLGLVSMGIFGQTSFALTAAPRRCLSFVFLSLRHFYII